MVYSPSAKNQALKMSQNAVLISELDCWSLLEGSKSVVFVLDDADDSQANALEEWLLDEDVTRWKESSVYGWIENIVYTNEGLRRARFLRLIFSVASPAGVFGERIANRLCGHSALQVANAFELPKQLKSNDDDPGMWAAWQYMLGCPCCTQRAAVTIRHRASALRTGVTTGMIRCAFSESTARNQLMRAGKDWMLSWIPFSLPTFFSFRTVPGRTHLPRTPPPPPPGLPCEHVHFECVFGDAELLDDRVTEIDPSLFVVNSDFRIAARLPNSYIWEYAPRNEERFAFISHSVSGATFAYQLGEYASLLERQVAGKAAQAEQEPRIMQWLVESNIWVSKKKGNDQDSKWKSQLATDGFVIFDQHALVPATYWRALRRFYRLLGPWLYANVPGDKFRMFNDEPVARHLNYELSEWATRLAAEPLVHSSLALSIFIKQGPGFIYHTDTSPPFDLTLDLVVDHRGPAPRPVYFARKRPDGSVYAHRVALEFGQSILFKGSEMTHWGGDLPAECFHSVVLLTWQYMRD